MYGLSLYCLLLVNLIALTVSQNCGDEYNAENTEDRTINEHIPMFTRRVKDLDINKYFDCLTNGHVDEHNITYHVGGNEGNTLFFKVDIENLMQRYNVSSEDCETEYGDGSFNTEFFTYTTLNLENNIRMAEAMNDDRIIGSNVEADNDSLGRSIDDKQVITGEAQDGDVEIEFLPGSGQEQLDCGIRIGDCCNKCKSTYRIYLTANVNGVNYAGGYSHHDCVFKGRDDGKTIVNVKRRSKKYRVDSKPTLAIYSGGMSTIQMSNYWGRGANKRSCDIYN